jgi:prepilin-type processing-associated H-X9-DG protein
MIATIALLTSLSLPALSRSKPAARAAKCKSNLRQLGVALLMYVEDAQIYPYWQHPPDPHQPRKGLWAFWVDDLAPLLKSKDPWLDPKFFCTERYSPRTSGLPTQRLRMGREVPFQQRLARGYGYNALGNSMAHAPNLGLGWALLRSSDPTAFSIYPPAFDQSWISREDANCAYVETTEANVKVPSDMIALGCGETSSELLVFDGISLNGSPLGKAHQGRANVLFCDGHVAPIKPRPAWASPEDERRMWNKDHEPHDLSWAPF